MSSEGRPRVMGMIAANVAPDEATTEVLAKNLAAQYERAMGRTAVDPRIETEVESDGSVTAVYYDGADE